MQKRAGIKKDLGDHLDAIEDFTIVIINMVVKLKKEKFEENSLLFEMFLPYFV